jgi:hypothetical protein
MRYRQILTRQPSIEIYIQHVLFESGGVSADPNQQPSLRWLADDRMKRAAPSQISVEKCGGPGSVQCREHLFGTQSTGRPRLQGGQSMLRMRRAATMIQRAEKSGLKVVGACEPSARSRCDGPRTGLNDRSNAIGVEKRVVIFHCVRKSMEPRDRFRSRCTLLEDYPHDQVGRQARKSRALAHLVQADHQAMLVHSIKPSCQLMG